MSRCLRERARAREREKTRVRHDGARCSFFVRARRFGSCRSSCPLSPSASVGTYTRQRSHSYSSLHSYIFRYHYGTLSLTSMFDQKLYMLCVHSLTRRHSYIHLQPFTERLLSRSHRRTSSISHICGSQSIGDLQILCRTFALRTPLIS